MTVRQTNVNVIYPKISDYRKKFINSEDILAEHFQEATILPIPDEVQGEVPRIIARTKGGHSMLNIALEVATFVTNYDNEYNNEWDKCRTYLEKRGKTLYDIVDKMTDQKYIFSGIVTSLVFDEIKKDGIEILKQNLLKVDKMDSPFDAGCKFTYIYKEKYYVNISIENSRELVTEQKNNKIVIIGENQHTINITVDVNDRYATYYDGNYSSTKEEFSNLLEITNEIINNKLRKLLLKGEFSL